MYPTPDPDRNGDTPLAAKIKAAIIGSGNIGTDLMVKLLRGSTHLELAAMVGIDPDSEGLATARRMGVATTHKGIEGLLAMREFADVRTVFDATSAYAHKHHYAVLRKHGRRVIDLTPAAIGPFVVPAVNLDQNIGAPNTNMVSCGGQATIPIVAAVARVARVKYAEIVASVSSRSAGPGTRANIDEFTRTTARGIEVVGGAERAKAIIILNPAEPPMIMRDTVFTLSDDVPFSAIEESVKRMVTAVQKFVPGYRLKQELQFERIGADRPISIPGHGKLTGVKTAIYLEVEGAGDYLPTYAGNLDIMTAAAHATGELMAAHMLRESGNGL